MRIFRAVLSTIGLAAMLLPAGLAQAQTCGADYQVQDGDSLAKIASRAYGKSSQWTLIFYANQDRLGSGNSLLVPGLTVRIPCLDGNQAALPDAATAEAKAPDVSIQAPVLSSEVKRIQFLTATDYSPFTDSSLPNGGMLTDIVSTAMAEFNTSNHAGLELNVSWVNDWAAHLNPLLVTRAFDMGFPWAKPNCANFEELDTNGKYRCQKFFYSDSLFEEQTLVFLKKDSPIKMEHDSELVGKKLCRPTGFLTFDLDEQGRNWVKDKKVTLIRPASVDECLRLLADGNVDAFPINEMTGRSAMIRLDLVDKIRVAERPIGFITLHVIVAKTHPNARVMLTYLNTALQQLRASGRYDQIMEKHLQNFWDSQADTPVPKATSEVAPAKPDDSQPADAKPAVVKTTSTAAANDPAAKSGVVKK